ncbi:pirin family protein [Pseudalkalibacillus caeni]|uniref:Pirin family protein n=1 Tax=Exobacillus caeni TaxID=2574798 RepID=A0A5R9F5E8_9BACL|nr:pirin family protein [Pseudalkalibacillus caeni]TLS36043.1 pirin family protein [Pseudalkalibacillus caeni]
MNSSSRVQREIAKVWTVNHQRNSSTHKAGLILEPGRWEEFDPFLLMAEDWFGRGTFDFHPHRGMETVTYVLEEKLEHKDNHGGHGVLSPGDVQWMTAGSGIIHAEEPAGETVHTLQLWINLPSSKKMTEPRYQDLRKEDMPERNEEGARITVFSGSSAGVKAQTDNNVPITMVDVELEKDASVTQDLPGSFNGFIYVLEGKGYFGKSETPGERNQVLWLGPGEEKAESEVAVRADEKLRFLLYAGEPIGEPVVARGPFVMNSDEEIRQAYDDYRMGKFGR